MEALAKGQSHATVAWEDSRPVGGRQTDTGTIPDGWEVLPLSQLLDFQNGFNTEKASYGTGIPFANVLEVITKGHLTEADIPGRVGVNANQLQTFLVRPGDILFNRTSETQDELALASVYVGSSQIIFGGFVIRGRIKSNRLGAAFAEYLLRAPAVRRQIVSRGQGAVRANIGQSELGSVMIPLPPAHEQTAIAEALGECGVLIAELETLIVKKRQIKHGVMQELLSGQRRLPGFSSRWETRKLGDLGYFLKGSGVRKDQAQSGTLPCVRYGEIYMHHDYVLQHFRSHISREVAANATPIRSGDILFAGSGETKEEIGKCVALAAEIEAYAGGDIVILRTSNHDPAFLGYALNMPNAQRQKSSRGQGDSVVHISASALTNVEVELPELREQSSIAAALIDFDADLDVLGVRLEKMHQIKQGMMQELLTGKVRLI